MNHPISPKKPPLSPLTGIKHPAQKAPQQAPTSQQKSVPQNLATDHSDLSAIAVNTTVSAPPPLALVPEHPPIEIESEPPFTYYYANERTINQVDMGTSQHFTSISTEGMSIMLKASPQRTTLVFANMSDSIDANHKIPNVYFHFPPSADAKLSFNQAHQLVINLGQSETAIFDENHQETLREGPFKISFDAENGKLNVSYTGHQDVTRYRSRGDKIRW